MSNQSTFLQDISIEKNMRGTCSLCNKKSMRWAKWRHVEIWYKNHSCTQGPLSTKNGKSKWTEDHV